MIKLSVIIPVYKTPRELLVRMFESVLALPEDTEVICVLDSPGDPCGEVLDEYARKDLRIRVLRNAKNIGETSSRNRALEVIAGRYFTCVDADDVITAEAYLRAITLLEDLILDLCVVGMDGDGKTIFAEYDGEMSFCRDDVLRQAEMSSCGIVYRTEYVRKNNIRYPDGMPNNGDYVFATRCWWSTDKIAAIKAIGYHIVGHLESSSRVHYTARRFESCARAGRMVMEVLDGKSLTPRLVSFYLPRLICGQICHVIMFLDNAGDLCDSFFEDVRMAAEKAVKGFGDDLNPLVVWMLCRISDDPHWIFIHAHLIRFILRTGVLKVDIIPQLKRYAKNRISAFVRKVCNVGE